MSRCSGPRWSSPRSTASRNACSKAVRAMSDTGSRPRPGALASAGVSWRCMSLTSVRASSSVTFAPASAREAAPAWRSSPSSRCSDSTEGCPREPASARAYSTALRASPVITRPWR